MDRRARLTTGLLLVVVLTARAENPMRCYTCNAKVGGLDSVNCAVPNENTTTAVCRAGETFCKKKLVKGPSETTVDRRCYDTCTEQNDIHMGPQIFIDVFCCQGALCNAASPLTSPLAFLTLSVCGAVLVMALPTVCARGHM